MKIVALLPFKNESWVLRTYLSSVSQLVDEIIGIDDGSTDHSRHLVESAGGIVYENKIEVKSGWPEYEIREELLRLGRERGATHFVCLDADEAFTAPFIRNGRALLKELKPGQKLSMQWLALWKSLTVYRQDDSVWSNNFKDFAFCDDGTSHHEYAFLGVGRTPGRNTVDSLRRVEPASGAVLHFQFVSWQRFQMKQVWYRCAELIKAPGSEREINEKYKITLDDNRVGLERVPDAWLSQIHVPGGMEDAPDNSQRSLRANWHFKELLEWFDQCGIDFFERLQIWHIPQLQAEFLRRTGRMPEGSPAARKTGYLARLATRLRRFAA